MWTALGMIFLFVVILLIAYLLVLPVLSILFNAFVICLLVLRALNKLKSKTDLKKYSCSAILGLIITLLLPSVYFVWKITIWFVFTTIIVEAYAMFVKK